MRESLRETVKCKVENVHVAGMDLLLLVFLLSLCVCVCGQTLEEFEYKIDF